MTRCVAAAVLVLCAGLAANADEADKKFLKDVEGSYTPAAITKSGAPAAAAELKAVDGVTIKGDTFTVRFKKGEELVDRVATLVVDASKTPVAIDLIPKDGPKANQRIPGIAKLEKDTLTICWSDQREKPERPKDFSSTKEQPNFLIVLKRAK
jgi:uncharacterized protein (TIGR03067 family)